MQANLTSKIINLLGIIKTKLILEVVDCQQFEPIVQSFVIDDYSVKLKLSKSILDEPEFKDLLLLEVSLIGIKEEQGLSRLLKSGNKESLLQYLNSAAVNRDIDDFLNSNDI